MGKEDEEDCCDLVEYYSDKCCEEDDLFKQPESGHEGDCLLCCLPMTLDEEDLPEDPSDFWVLLIIHLVRIYAAARRSVVDAIMPCL